MENFVLTNTYEKRKEQEELFKKEIKNIVDALKKRFSKFVKIEVGYRFNSNKHDYNMLWADVVLLDAENEKCIHLQFRCDATVFISRYILKEKFKNVSSILLSRLLINSNPDVPDVILATRSKHSISIEVFPSHIRNCVAFLRSPLAQPSYK